MLKQIIVVGAGLAGLGAAISCLLAGHDVQILEAAEEIREVGAGIQVLPNSSRILLTRSPDTTYDLSTRLQFCGLEREPHLLAGLPGIRETVSRNMVSRLPPRRSPAVPC